MNSSSLKTSLETDENDARVGLVVIDSHIDPDRPVGPMETNPGPFQDIPHGVWIIFLSAWALLFSLFILFFTVTPAAAFAVTVAGFFGLMAFGLPIVMATQGRCEGHECSGIVQTRNGPLSVAAAGTQIVLIPIAAVIGLAAFIGFAM